jgi:hypothetical protein
VEARCSNPYRLGSQNPQDNRTWGLGRVEVPADVAFDEDTVLRFAVTAPARSGRYQFQWRMLQEGVAWFGESTPATSILVTSPQLRVTVQPHPMPLNVSTQVTVSTVDVETGTRVSGEVLINGAVVGRTNTTFTYTFRVRLESGPLPRTGVNEVLSEPTLTAPTGLVRAAGYPDTSIDFGRSL